MELKEGQFIRFEGMINKILELDDDYIVFDVDWYDHWNDEVSSMQKDKFVKEYNPIFKDNIIDLIEIGDYVNGYYVEDVKETFINIATGSNYFQSPSISEEDIKTIVTKEQMESMQYEVK